MNGNRFGIWLVPLLSAACSASSPPSPPAPAPAAAAAPAPVAAVAPPFAHPWVREVPMSGAYARALEVATRSATGAPGGAYWQNRASYRIEAELDPDAAILRGWEQITYRNESPAPLRSLALNLYQNIFSEGVPRNRFAPITGGITLERVAAQGEDLERRSLSQLPITTDPANAPVGYSVQGTLGRIRLPRPVGPGESVVVEIEWQHRVPEAPSFRTAWEEALGSRAFQIAQWYPRIAVFDDLQGWAVNPYLGDGEFYLEYGDFEVALTLPSGYLVGATGALLNAEEVLTEEARQRWAAAIDSDSVTHVVTAADLSADNATQVAMGGQLTWRFAASDVRDFAFATSNSYVWDATGTTVPDGAGGTRRVAVHAFYRPGAPNWEEAVRYGQHATRFISEALTPYLYPQITISEGSITGMEYPMLVFIHRPPAAIALYTVIAHEIAHEWFPMAVGQDEAAYAWMDEGLATFLENRAAADFAPDYDGFALDRNVYLNVAGSDREVPIARHTDLVSPYGARTVAAYSKPATLFRALRHVLGEEIFDGSLRTFATEWLLKKPTPWDFFATFERVSGEGLDWFFYPWWFETAVMDHGILAVAGAESGRAVVTVEDLGEVPVPSILRGTTATGRAVEGRVPVETWLSGAKTAEVVLESAEPIVSVELDPEELFPDVNDANDVWEAAR